MTLITRTLCAAVDAGVSIAQLMSDIFAFNPRSAGAMAAAIMLLNGAVLGLMHKALAEEARPSALYWRIGTLLSAGGCVLQAVQDLLPLGLALPLSNFLLALSISCYWKALSLFYDKSPGISIWLPPAILAAFIYYYAIIQPDLGIRVIAGSLATAWLTGGCAYVLFRYGKHERMISRSVLMIIASFVSFIMVLRALVAYLYPPTAVNLLEIQSWSFMLIMIFFTLLPIIGTTAFVLMCTERYQIRWKDAASTDYLTRLSNRRTISEIGIQAFQTARRKNTSLSIGVLDVDHFKRINDTYGHDAGDQSLKFVADVLLHHQNSNCVGRLGGEEFLIVWEGSDQLRAMDAANKILARLKVEVIPFKQATLRLTASMGVAMLEESDADFDHLLQRADQALYIAKASGRDRAVLAS
jgi:diguanylate cyclase (GGDEF)-like protein